MISSFLNLFFKPPLVQFLKNSKTSLFFNQLRLKRTQPIILRPELAEIIKFSKEDPEFRTTKAAALESIQVLFGVRRFIADEIIHKNKNLWNVNRAFLKNILSTYSKYGVKNETLLKYPELLTAADIPEKIKHIAKLPCNTNDTIVLALLDTGKLAKFVENEIDDPEKSKIRFLSTSLNLSERDVCECLVSKPFIISINNSLLEEKIKLLTEFGVTTIGIMNDLWVLRYSTRIIKERLTLVKECKVADVKTWMVRATPKIYQHYIQRRSDNKSILGESSLAEYLSERLECSLATANYIILKQPVLKNKSLKKLKDLIDCLLSAGFQPTQICRVPKLLVHSVETTQARLKKLDEKGLKLDTLSILTKSHREFNLQYDALLKNKNKTAIN